MLPFIWEACLLDGNSVPDIVGSINEVQLGEGQLWPRETNCCFDIIKKGATVNKDCLCDTSSLFRREIRLEHIDLFQFLGLLDLLEALVVIPIPATAASSLRAPSELPVSSQ